MRKLREDSAFYCYEPWGDQVRFHKSPAKTRLLLGSNRAGKSEAGIMEHLSHVRKHRFDGTRDNILQMRGDHIALFSKRMNIDLVYIKKFRKYVKGFRSAQNPGPWIKHIKNASDGYPEKIEWANGDRTFLGSWMDPSVQEGPDWLSAWFDEPPPLKTRTAVRRGLTDVGGYEFFTCTALGCPWLYDMIYTKADGIIKDNFHILLKDNPYVGEQEKLRFRDDIPPHEFAARWEGRFGHLEGAVFPEFSRADHVIDPFTIPRDWPIFMVKDPHSRRPSVMLWVACNPADELFVVNEWPHDDFFAMTTCTHSISDYVGYIAKEEAQFSQKIYDRIMDPSFARAKSATTGLELVDEYAEHGLDFHTDINNDITIGHDRIHEHLRTDRGVPKIRFFKSCLNTIKAFEMYAWRQKDFENTFSTAERPSEAGKDYPDCLRYLLDFEPTYSHGQWYNPEEEESDHGTTGYGF